MTEKERIMKLLKGLQHARNGFDRLHEAATEMKMKRTSILIVKFVCDDIIEKIDSIVELIKKEKGA